MPIAAFASDDVDGVRRQVPGHLYLATGEHVSCEVDSPEPLQLPIDVATPLALILNEAVGNAFKHAFPDRRPSRIVVSLRRTEDGIRIEVRDDGVGLSHEHATRASQLLGIRLIRLLAAQIKAGISWQSQGGTTFGLDLPLRPAAVARP